MHDMAYMGYSMWRLNSILTKSNDRNFAYKCNIVAKVFYEGIIYFTAFLRINSF